MSDLKSVFAFFIGLVFFIVLVIFAIGRIRMSVKPTITVNLPTITLTLTPTPTGLKAAKKPSFLSKIFGFFAPKPAVLTPTPIEPTLMVPTSPPMKQALKPTVIVYTQTKGGIKQPKINTVSGVTTIPETGAETFVLPLAGALGGLGIYLKKRK